MRLTVGAGDKFADAIPPSYKQRNSVTMFYKGSDPEMPAAMLRVFPMSKTVVEIGDVWVAEDLRGQLVPAKGIKWSYMLLCATLSALRRRGVMTVWLWTVASNEAAISVYTKLGFTDAETKHKRFDPVRLRAKFPWLKSEPIVLMSRATCSRCSRRCSM